MVRDRTIVTLTSADRLGRACARGVAARMSLAAVLGLVAWLSAMAPALAVQVTGWDHGAYGRLVLDWGRPVAVSVDARETSIVIAADAPIDAPVGTAARRLSAYVDRIAIEDEGRRLVLMTAAPMAAERRPFDNGLVLDLRPISQAGAEADRARSVAAEEPAAGVGPPLTEVAQAPSGQAPSGQPLVVRGGEHGSFSRIVFDWTEPVTYRTERDGAVLRLIFDRPAQPDFGQVNPRGLSRVGAIARMPDRDGGMVTAVTIPPDARVRFFDYGLKTVVDILGGTPNSAPDAVPQDLAATAGAEERDEAVDDAVAATPAPAPAQESAPAQEEVAAREEGAPTEPTTTPAPPSAVPPAPSSPASPAPPPATPDASADAAPASRGPEAAESASAPAAAAEEPPPAAAVDRTTASEAAPTAPPPPGASAAATLPPAAAEAAPDLGDASVAAPDGEPEVPEAGVTPFTATFDPGRPARLAAFARGDVLWVVFAADAPLDVAALLSQGEAAFGEGEAIEAAGGTALMWPLEGAIGPGIQPWVSRRGDSWTVALTRGEAEDARPVRIERQPDFPLGARLFVAEPEAEQVVGVRDPRIGDRLLVVPLDQPAVGLDRRRRLVGFDLLPSGQGLVVRPLDDALAVRPVTGGVEITRPDGLPLSPESAATATPAGLTVGQVFDIPRWQGPAGGFVETRRRLRRAVIDAPEAGIDQARLDLARFYFAHGLGEEAEAMIDLVERSTPGVADRPEFHAMRGAIAVLTGDGERAVADLSDPELQDSAELDLWRGAAAALTGDWPAARSAFEDAGELISTYPAPFRDRFFIAAMEAALREGDAATAEAGLDWLADETGGASDRRPRIAFLRGEIADASAQPDTAVRWWQRAAESDDRLWRTRAELALIRQGLDDGTLVPDHAVERLEALRFAWRGDALEIAILETLGDAAWAAGRHAEAFEHYDRAAAVLPGTPEAEAVAASLPRRYRELLGGPALDDTSPLAAFAVFEDRKDLLPEGEAGDRIVERVAESLASIDLLDRAAGLMETLVDERLEEPAEIARIGARAAGLRLLDRDPAQALAVLDRTEPPDARRLPTPMTAAGLAVERAAAGEFEPSEAAIEAATEASADAADAADPAGDGNGGDVPAQDELAADLDRAMAEVMGEEAAAALAGSIEAVSDGANAGAPVAGEAASGDPAERPAPAEAGPEAAPQVAAAPAGAVTPADGPGASDAAGTADDGGALPDAAAENAGAPAGDLLAERRLLRARALADLGRPERALALLADDRSDLAEAAKLDIAWSNRLWGAAAEVLARRVGEPPALGESIDEAAARRVVDLAVATALADDRPALDRLAIGFGPAMQQTDYANTFAVLTRAGDDAGPLEDLAAVRRQVEEIGRFESFLDTYRARTAPALIN